MSKQRTVRRLGVVISVLGLATAALGMLIVQSRGVADAGFVLFAAGIAAILSSRFVRR